VKRGPPAHRSPHRSRFTAKRLPGFTHSGSAEDRARLRELLQSGVLPTLVHKSGAARKRQIFLITVLAVDDVCAAALTESGIVEALCGMMCKTSGDDRLSETERQWILIALSELAARPCSSERVQRGALTHLADILAAILAALAAESPSPPAAAAGAPANAAPAADESVRSSRASRALCGRLTLCARARHPARHLPALPYYVVTRIRCRTHAGAFNRG